MSASASKTASVLGFVVAVLGIAGLAARQELLAAGPIGIAVQVLAILLMIWARITFGMRSFHLAANPTSGGLVTNGPYRYWRHPIYAAILYFVAAAVVTHRSPWSLGMGALIALGLAVRMVNEEKLVRQMYPEYKDYARRTRRVIPYLL